MTIPGHFLYLGSSGEVRAEFDRQAADDWRSFLSLRAQELRSGGRLVVVLPGLSDEGGTGFEPLFAHANEVLADMVSQGTITAEERARMVLGAYPRRRSQLLEPFHGYSQYRGLTVECCELSPLRDSAWEDYEQDGDQEKLIKRHVGSFRAIFVPSLAAALESGGKSQVFADEFARRLTRRLANQPAPYHSFTQTMVLAKGK